MKKRIILIIASAVLFAGLLLLILHTPPVRGKVLNLLIDNLQKQGIPLDAESLDYNLLKFRFTLKKPIIRAPDEKEFPPFLRAEEVTVAIPLAFLWQKKLEFKDIDIRGASLYFRVNADGTTNNPIRTDPEAPPPELIIHRLQVTDASLTYLDRKENVFFQVPVFQVNIDRQNSDTQQLRLVTVKEASFRFRDRELLLEQLRVETQFHRRQIDIHVCRLQVGSSRFELKGTIDDYPSSPVLELIFTGKGQLTDFTRVFPLAVHGSGLSPEQKKTIEGLFGGSGAELSKQKPLVSLSRGDFDFRLRVSGSPGKIATEIQALQAGGELSTPGARAGAKLRVADGRLTGDFTAETVDIKKLYPLLKNIFPDLYDTAANTLKIDGHLALSGNIHGTMKKPLLDVRVESKGLSLPDNNLRFALDGTLGLAPPYPVKAVIKMDTLSLEVPGQILPANFRHRVSGSITGEIKLRANLDNLENTAALDIDIQRFQVKTPVHELTNREPIRISYDPSGIRIHSLVLEGFGTYRLEGELPLPSPASRDAAAKTIDLRFTFRDISRDVLDFLSPGMVPGDMGFAVSGRCEINGSGYRPEQISARLVLDTLELKGPGIALHQEAPTELRWEKGNLRLNPTRLAGTGYYIRADGEADVGKTPRLNLSVQGELDMKFLNSFFNTAAFSGSSKFNFRAAGSPREPVIGGTVDFHDAGARFTAGSGLFFNRFNGRITLDNRHLRVESLKGNFNGGTLEITGESGFGPRGIGQAVFTVSIDKVRLDTTEGFRSEISGTLTFTAPESGGERQFRLSGRLDMPGAVYRQPFSLESELSDYLRRKPGAAAALETEAYPGEEQPGFLDRLFLNIGLYTSEPILVDNNIARAEIAADLTLAGTAAHPVLAGRASVKDGGEIYLGKNTYAIEQGTIDFLNPAFIEPDLKLEAYTSVRDYRIRLSLSGTPRALSASLTSTPSLSETDIISMLVTGNPPGNVSSASLDTVGSQALLYLDASLAGRLEKIIQKTLGLENVRIDGSLATARENPDTRITIGQSITPNLHVTLSQGLRQTRSRTWLLDFNPITHINLQGTVRNDNQYTAAIRHQLEFGLKKDPGSAAPAPRKKRKPVVRSIVIRGDTGVPETLLRKKLKLKPGKPFDFFTYREALDRIRKLYLGYNFLNLDLESKRETQEDKKNVDIYLDIDAGPRVYFDFPGAKIPRKLLKKIKAAWLEGQFEERCLRDTLQLIRGHFLKKGYHQVVVGAPGPVRGDRFTRYILEIKPGIRFAPPRLEFRGNRLVSARELAVVVKKNRLIPVIFTRPGNAARFLEEFYKKKGFLRARVALPEIQSHSQQKITTLSFLIEENQRFMIGKISYEGNRFLTVRDLEQKTGLRQGDIYQPGKFNDAAYQIKTLYAAKGFNDVRVQVKTAVREKQAGVDFHFIIHEDHRGMVKDIGTRGNKITRGRIIRRALTFKAGDILNAREIGKSRKRLYELGIFQRVNISSVPMENKPSSSAGEEKVPSQPYRVEIEVAERKPWLVRYGVHYDTDVYLGLEGEVQNRNLFGAALMLGASLRVNRREQEARFFSRSPYIFKKKIDSESFVFIKRREESAFTEERAGITLQQQVKAGRYALFSWGYTFEKKRTVTYPLPNNGGKPGAESVVNLGYLTAAVTLDKRDSLMNPGSGIFTSHSLQYGARFLGSEAVFLRFFGQCSFYREISAFLVSASSVRIGLGSGLGHEMVPGERFYAGGGTTLRGFAHNRVEPAGGDALFIFNQELRFSLFKEFGAVLFMDIGNVYPEVSAFNFFDVRKTLGVGFRFRIASIMMRLDWGFKLDRRAGESASRIFFSIGQAF